MPKPLTERQRINKENYEASMERRETKRLANIRDFREKAGLHPDTGAPLDEEAAAALALDPATINQGKRKKTAKLAGNAPLTTE